VVDDEDGEATDQPASKKASSPPPKKRAAKRATVESDGDEESGEEIEESPSKKEKKKNAASPIVKSPRSATPKGGAKLTPLQVQVLEVKAANPGVVLCEDLCC
jgi:hypothetical protein